MGLDMYLSAKRYLSDWRDADKPIIEQLKTIPGLIPGGDLRPKYVILEAAYWRKANHIHRWFVENVQDGADDCGHYWVPRAQLHLLVDLCRQILADKSQAQDLLPTQNGFFFGSTMYDEGYYSDLELTVTMLEKALRELPEEDWEFEYRSSW